MPILSCLTLHDVTCPTCGHSAWDHQNVSGHCVARVRKLLVTRVCDCTLTRVDVLLAVLSRHQPKPLHPPSGGSNVRIRVDDRGRERRMR